MRLWHDDIRPAPEGWTWARRNWEAMVFLELGVVDEISLDHDLGFHDVVIPDDPDELMEVLMLRGESPETGFDLVSWMCDDPARVPAKVTVHSWNPEGAQRMARLLNNCGHDVTVEPFKV